jgi:peptidoglycan/LPS O-acetylase OafA/YrhL
MSTHIPYLDGWRGLAIACLLTGHFFPVAGINFGTVGVALFFVLSGLLMARVLFLQRAEFGAFYRRRIARVFPSVAVYLAAITCIYLLLGEPVVLAELLPAMSFTNNYFVTDNWTMPFGHIWSLSVEEHSYVVLSLAAGWSRVRGGRGLSAMGLVLGLVILATGVVSLAPALAPSNAFLRTEVASFGILFSGFALLAFHYGGMRPAWRWMAPIMLLIGVAAHWWSVPPGVRVLLGWGALALALNTMAHAPRLFLAMFEQAWLRRLGTVSFSLYLWQQPFYQLVHQRGMPPLLGLALSIAVGLAAFYLIERPARTYLNTRWTGKANPAPPAASDAPALQP